MSIIDVAQLTEIFGWEIFYLVMGCASLVIIDWLKERVLSESPANE